MNSIRIEHKDAYDPKTDQLHQLAIRAMGILLEAGYEARLAGGCVRDRLLGIRPKDYDIATSAHPDQVCSVFKQKNLKTIPTGIDHGTVTLVIAGQGMEITSLRKDVATDGRRAVVAFSQSFEEDSLRRDFTINALYEDRAGRVYDFHGGLADLKSGRLAFVGDAVERIREDYLRILRFYRFWARLGFTPAEGLRSVLQAEKRGLAQISQERKTSELLGLLESAAPGFVVAEMARDGVLGMIYPQSLENGTFESLDALILNTKAETALARLAVLVQKTLKKGDWESVLSGLKLSVAQRDRILAVLLESPPDSVSDPAQVWAWIDRVENRLGKGIWSEWFERVLPVLRPEFPVKDLEKTRFGSETRRTMPLSGAKLKDALGLSPGPELGTLLDKLKASYRRGEWTTEDEGLSQARLLIV